MEIFIFFARLYGVFYLVFGLLFIISRQLGRTIEMTENKSFVISTGYISFFLGLITIILHNVWVLNWTVAITLLGWATFIKGIIKIAAPEQIHKRAQAFKKGQIISSIFMILLGGWLLVMSFI